MYYILIYIYTHKYVSRRCTLFCACFETYSPSWRVVYARGTACWANKPHTMTVQAMLLLMNSNPPVHPLLKFCPSEKVRNAKK